MEVCVLFSCVNMKLGTEYEYEAWDRETDSLYCAAQYAYTDYYFIFSTFILVKAAAV